MSDIFLRNYFDKKRINFIIINMEVNIIKSKFLRGLFDQNTYVLTDKNQAVIIDAGAELEDVKKVVGKRRVLAILMTHLHFDHFWNLDKYLSDFDCPVFIKEDQEEKFENPKHNGSVVIRKDFAKKIDKKYIKYYAKKLVLGNFEFDVFDTFGHSSDCVCLLTNRNLFTGDTIFSDCVGRTDLYDSDNDKMLESLKLIQTIDFERAYPGHYESATKDEILKTISFYL